MNTTVLEKFSAPLPQGYAGNGGQFYMIHIIFYNKSVDALLYGWSNPTLRIIMGIEIIAIIAGITVGNFTPKNRLANIFVFVVGGVGLLLVLKNIMFGLNSDAEILLPFVGESLLVGATIAFCMRLRKG